MNFNLDNLSTDTAKRLRALREDKNISPETLAQQLEAEYNVNISHDSLRSYEIVSGSRAGRSNGMRAQTLRVLSHYYGVSSDYLLGLTDDPAHDGDSNMSAKLSDDTMRWIERRHLEHKRGNECSLDALLGNKLCQRLLCSLLKYSAAVAAMNQIAEIREEIYPVEREEMPCEEWESRDRAFYRTIEDQASRHPNGQISEYMVAMMQLMKAQSDDWRRGLNEIGANYDMIVKLQAHNVEEDLALLLNDLRSGYDGNDVPNREKADRQEAAYWKYNYMLDD